MIMYANNLFYFTEDSSKIFLWDSISKRTLSFDVSYTKLLV